MKTVARLILFLFLVLLFCETDPVFSYSTPSIEASESSNPAADNSNWPDSPFCFDNHADDHSVLLLNISQEQTLDSRKICRFSRLSDLSVFYSSPWQPPESYYRS